MPSDPLPLLAEMSPPLKSVSSLWARTFGSEDTGDPSDVPGQPRCIRGRKRSVRCCLSLVSTLAQQESRDHGWRFELPPEWARRGPERYSFTLGLRTEQSPVPGELAAIAQALRQSSLPFETHDNYQASSMLVDSIHETIGVLRGRGNAVTGTRVPVSGEHGLLRVAKDDARDTTREDATAAANFPTGHRKGRTAGGQQDLQQCRSFHRDNRRSTARKTYSPTHSHGATQRPPTCTASKQQRRNSALTDRSENQEITLFFTRCAPIEIASRSMPKLRQMTGPQSKWLMGALCPGPSVVLAISLWQGSPNSTAHPCIVARPSNKSRALSTHRVGFLALHHWPSNPPSLPVSLHTLRVLPQETLAPVALVVVLACRRLTAAMPSLYPDRSAQPPVLPERIMLMIQEPKRPSANSSD
ncbi:hypothetical protein Purlil1_14194 [Purpureocillium lilacinum]|uniref:Uncharacterized protein n=1 Tax=Purpureocillium lilacinum TaxID=33203 RepID=A0ABR0BBY8_PURLI|nr:hypothetical protein Purlil1_14194 [Purpureocillium lilacinum]